MSYISITAIGAKQTGAANVLKWSTHIYDAFVFGAWLLFWTDKTLFWIAKPTLHQEQAGSQKRFHNEKYAALESDIENLYFWHGVMVPAFVVVRPDWITIKHIETEENAEVRRIMIERYGQAKYLLDSKAVEIHRDDFGILFRKDIPNDEPIFMVQVVNSTPEPDGHFKDYWIRVPPTIKRAKEGVAWTFQKTEEEYQPCQET